MFGKPLHSSSLTNYTQTVMPEIENKEEENYKNQITSSNEEVTENISLEQAAEPTQPETQNSQSQTENMEVHKHPHHVTHKKKWGEYLLEFFMIFLAVTMGLFAEQMREDFVENQHEKQYMVSLVKDLESDTLQINNIIQYRIAKITKMDSLLIYFSANNSSTISFAQYNLIQQLWGHLAFFQNSGTLDQLNNSGGLRMIQKRNVVDSIESYNQQIKRMSLRDDYETDFMIENSKLAQKLFKSKSALKIMVDSVYLKKQIMPGKAIAINEQNLDEYLNSLIRYRIIVLNDMALQTTINNKAGRLLTLIKKEYHLE